MKIGNAIDSGDELHGQMRTPPQSKMNAVAVAQLHETSPLETSSDASLDSGPSPPASDQHLILPTHSRGSSTDTTASSQVSGSSHTLQNSALGLKVGTPSETRDRPHSYSGGLSSADLRRLQTAGSPLDTDQAQPWSALDRQSQYEQPVYPSMAGYARQQGPVPSEDLQVDYAVQQRQYQPLLENSPPAFTPRAANGMSFRPGAARSFNPQVPGMIGSGPNVGYPAPPAHTGHMSLGNAQQLYEMMMPSHENPAVARVQQQHNVFRGTHQHSASDPLHLREAAALLNGSIPPYGGPGMYAAALAPPQAIGMYPNQFYPQDPYAPAGVAAQVMAASLQSQYPGPYGVMSGQGMNGGMGPSSPPASLSNVDPNGNGPSANNRKLGLYKTELCRSWEEKGACRYGPKCQFAHGEDEIRKVSRHPKYKTEICRTFWVSGSCPYGKRCCFIHTELPASGAPPGADGAPPPKVTETRGRSDSESNDPPVSLLARISAKRNQEAASAAHSENTTPTSYQAASRPPTGSLRVDTSSLDSSTMKQHHKSAYPTFATNSVLYPSNEGSGNVSPGPVTAGPDLGRQRANFVDYPQNKAASNKGSNGNARHSFNGSDVSLNLNTTPPNASGHSSPFGVATPDNSGVAARPNGHGHARSGSAGNWGSFARSGHLAAPSPFHNGPQSASPGNEAKLSSTPWLAPEAGANARFAEKAWA
ncbi:hypothetical protein FA95DRAFT_552046 [Auriscalpium vulgare]|uniref:Uncharacterized protein n=1 Tax=Auriscalpium vulgare TaxID=40419 RepID=A0ACB8S487_9AGAM|nr:hypothetical protein FA95DRAFT_552046 [Auriscalpium vulgare]